MTEIEMVLDQVKDKITGSLTELDVKCTAEELNTLCSVLNLSVLKLRHPMQPDFEVSQSLVECYARCLADPNYYRVLEFVYLSNPCVQKNVEYIFPQVKHE